MATTAANATSFLPSQKQKPDPIDDVLSEQQQEATTMEPQLPSENQMFQTLQQTAAALSSSSSSYYNNNNIDQSAAYLSRMMYGNPGGIDEHPSILGPLLRSGRESNSYPAYPSSSPSTYTQLETQLKLRTVRADSSGSQFVCGICGSEFGMRCRLIAHVRKHTGEKPFACIECGRAFSDQGNLQRHRYTHSTEPRFHCTTCGKYFRQASCLSNHRRFHCSGATGRPCMFCKRTFRSSSSLQIHLRFKHRDDATAAVVATAAAAAVITGNSSPLPVPMVTMGNQNGATFPQDNSEASNCHRAHTDCGVLKRPIETGRRTAKWRRKTRLPRQVPPSNLSLLPPPSSSPSLTENKLMPNENEETHVSSLNDFANFKAMAAAVFSTASAVVASASSDHRGRACNFACPSCPRRFTFQCRLAAHLRCHTNQRPFICPDCGRSFTQRGYLVRHAAVHKLDRPFTCDVCQRAYKHYGSLANHKRTHSSQLGGGGSNDDDDDDAGDEDLEGGAEPQIPAPVFREKRAKRQSKKSSGRPEIDLNSIPMGPEPRPFLQQYCENSLSNPSMSPFWSPTQHSTFMHHAPPNPPSLTSGYQPPYNSVFSSPYPNTQSFSSASSFNSSVSFLRPFYLPNTSTPHR